MGQYKKPWSSIYGVDDMGMAPTSYSNIAYWIHRAQLAHVSRLPEEMHSCLLQLYLYLVPKVKEEERQGLEDQLEKVETFLYERGVGRTPLRDSRALRDLYKVLRVFMLELDRVGILYNVQVDPAEMVRYG